MSFGPEYTKIQTMFKRTERGLIIPGEWSTGEFAYLADKNWRWTEKVDGTNIRLHWDGTRVTIGGRTDNAQVPATLVAALSPLVTDVARWRAAFPDDADDVTVYGEGYGAKIQGAGKTYRDDQALIVFDVKVGRWWLHDADVHDVAAKLGLDTVPVYFSPGLTLTEAAAELESGKAQSAWPNARIEGLVGRPDVDLFDRKGERIITKIKVKDFTRLVGK